MSSQILNSRNDLLWNYRILLLQTEEPEAFLKECQKKTDALADRKLLVVVFPTRSSAGSSAFYLNQDLEMAPELARQLQQTLGDQYAVLIGLDGGVKARFSSKSFSLEKTFARIDSMPMRQQELQNRNP